MVSGGLPEKCTTSCFMSMLMTCDSLLAVLMLHINTKTNHNPNTTLILTVIS